MNCISESWMTNIESLIHVERESLNSEEWMKREMENVLPNECARIQNKYVCVCVWMRHTDYLKSKRQPMNRICGLNGETTNGCTHHTHTRTQTPRQNVFNANWTACGKCSRFINVIDCLSNSRINLMCGHGFYFELHIHYVRSYMCLFRISLFMQEPQFVAGEHTSIRKKGRREGEVKHE